MDLEQAKKGLLATTTWQKVYVVLAGFSLATLVSAAPAAAWFVEAPPRERVEKDPRMRAGSAGPHRHHWLFGGGYHGGK